MNEDDLRSILRSEAERIDVGDDSWSRLESRLSPRPAGSAPRAFAFGAVAIGVAVALVVGVTWMRRDDRRTARVATGRNVMPSRIIAVTTHYALVVLDSHSGRVIRTLARDVALSRGTPALALTPDGRSVYFSTHVATRGGQCPSQDMVLRVTIDGRGSFEEAPGPVAALSPDGRRLAVLGIGPTPLPPGVCGGQRQLEIRDLTRGTTQYFGIADGSIDRLSWSSDSISLAFRWLKGTSQAYVLNAQTARALSDAVCVCKQSDPGGWFGYLGGADEFLGSRAPKVGSRAPSRVVALDPGGSIRRTLFRSRGPISGLASDRTGSNILAMFPKEEKPDFFVDSLYRWSRGDKGPTKVRDGIVAAAWIPNAPRADRALPEIVAVPSSPDRRVLVLDTRSGRTKRQLASLPVRRFTPAG